MVAAASAGARFRQRKISVKQSLNVYRQDELPDLEAEQQRNVHEIESGVDKAEETEEHLQKVILAAEAAVNGKKVDQVYIPTPDASKHWGEASKYYKGKFVEPASYIKFSATVEDTSGCQYNMDEEDEEFLVLLNKESKKPLSETEFEIVCERYEKVIEQKQPFLTIDPESIYSYEDVKEFALTTNETSPEDVTRTLEEELNIHPFVTLFDSKEIKTPRKLSVLLNLYGEKIYEHWKSRRIRRLGKPVFPTLKFEEPTEKNDDDPYVCFRRREFRQARKTRRTDTQGSERLRRLHLELKSVRELVLMCAQREVKRLEALKVEKNIFKLRCDVKALKRDLNISGEEEDLIAHKKKKVVPPEPKKEDTKDGKSKLGRPKLHELNPNQDISIKSEDQRKVPVNPVAAQPYVKLPASKIPDIDLVTVQAVLNEKESAIARAVYEKLKTRKELDRGWINLTDDSNNPLFEINQPNVKLVEKSHVPFSSISTSLYEVKSANYIDPHISDAIRHKRVLPNSKSFRASNGQIVEPSTPEYYQLISNPPSSFSSPLMHLRKRIGRGNITYIDRKFKRTFDEMDEYLNFSEDDDDVDMDEDTTDSQSVEDQITEIKEAQESSEPPQKKSRIKNVYDSSFDLLKRLKSRWLFDNESTNEVLVDPSRLNNISSQTQSIRFGSMILTKSLQNLQQQHRNHLVQQQQQLQLQQQQQQQQQKNGVAHNTGTQATNGTSNTKVKNSTLQKPAGSGNSSTPSAGSTPMKNKKASSSLKNTITSSTTTNGTKSSLNGGSGIRTGISTG